MSDEVALQLVKQLKRLNRWVTFFGSLTLVTLFIIGFVLFKIVTFVQSVGDKVGNVGSSLNVQQQACNGDGSFANFLRKNNMCD